MFGSNKGIILEDALISFLVLSSFVILMCMYLTQLYNTKNELSQISNANEQLKMCMFNSCLLSIGNNVNEHCEQITYKNKNSEICIYV